MAALHAYKSGVFALSAICGLVDAACFLALGGVFAELMTGNLLLLAFSLAAGNLFGAHALACLFAIVPFCLGALVAGTWANGRHPLGARLIGYPVEYAAIVLATVLALVLQPQRIGPLDHDLVAGGPLQWQRPPIAALLAFAMAIHNALMRRHGVSDIATNVLTLTLTGLVSESRWAGGRAPHWRRRALSIVLFVAGAAGGAWLLRYGVAAPLIAASAIFTVALWPLMKGRVEGAPAG
jgi:uncharacterized membrane protein YoaK (UPF0700 family)